MSTSANADTGSAGPVENKIMVIVWVVVAIVAPTGPFVGLLFLGPFVNRALMNFVQGLR